MDFRAGIGSLACRLCGASYQMPVHHLHEPIDVFSEWLDDCEAAAHGRATNPPPGASTIPRYEEDTDEENDDDIPAPSGLSRPKGSKASSSSGTAGAATTATGAKSGAAAAAQPSYTDLGLEDSDDDSDED